MPSPPFVSMGLSGGKSINYGQEILELLDTVWAPKWVAVIYC
jgi:hypothetical protein